MAESQLPKRISVFCTLLFQVDAYSSTDPVIVYARITRGGHAPVLNARVTATVFKPEGGGEPTELILNDNGAGYPDVTAGDGIYSAYFADFAPIRGHYSIRVEADNNDGLARTPKITPDFALESGSGATSTTATAPTTNTSMHFGKENKLCDLK